MMRNLGEQDIKALNRQIVDNSKAADFLNIRFIDQPQTQIRYYDYETQNNDLVYREFVDFVKVSDYRVSASVTQDQINQLKELWGIDVVAMTTNAIVNEMSQMMSKQYIKKISELAEKNIRYTLKDKFLHLFYRLLKKEYVKTIKVKNSKELIQVIISESGKIFQRTKRKCADFIICSLHTACILQDSEMYLYQPEDKEIKPCNGSIYPIGKIANLNIYVDPNMTWNDNRIFIGAKTENNSPGIHLVFCEGGTQHDLYVEVEGVGSPKIMLTSRYAIAAIGKNAHYNYEKFTYRTPKYKNPLNITLL